MNLWIGGFKRIVFNAQISVDDHPISAASKILNGKAYDQSLRK